MSSPKMIFGVLAIGFIALAPPATATVPPPIQIDTVYGLLGGFVAHQGRLAEVLELIKTGETRNVAEAKQICQSVPRAPGESLQDCIKHTTEFGLGFDLVPSLGW